LAGADEEAATILSIPGLSTASRIDPLIMLDLVRARRGDQGAAEALDELRDLALATDQVWGIGPMAAARAEWRWLQEDHGECAAEASVGLHLALEHNDPHSARDVAIWLWRGCAPSEAPDGTPTADALQIADDWRAAARARERMGCPYERALALLDGDEAAQPSVRRRIVT
jgi:hypothetical protein